MQDIGTARERKLAKGSVLETKPAAVSSVSRGRESPARVPWEQGTSKAKENLNNVDTKAVGREVISSCHHKLGGLVVKFSRTSLFLNFLNFFEHFETLLTHTKKKKKNKIKEKRKREKKETYIFLKKKEEKKKEKQKKKKKKTS